MLHIATSSPPCHLNVERNHLARIRRQAKKRGFRILKAGTYSMVDDARISPPRALAGLEHRPLAEIESAVATPLPPPRPPRQRSAVGRLTEAQPSQASHPAADSFVSLIDLVKESAS